jgi:predicted metal-binding protein
LQARPFAGAGGRVPRVNCLDACNHSNVVALRSQRHGEIWFGGLANDAARHALMKFVRAGASGDVPADLRPLRFVPSPNS